MVSHSLQLLITEQWGKNIPHIVGITSSICLPWRIWTPEDVWAGPQCFAKAWAVPWMWKGAAGSSPKCLCYGKWIGISQQISWFYCFLYMLCSSSLSSTFLAPQVISRMLMSSSTDKFRRKQWNVEWEKGWFPFSLYLQGYGPNRPGSPNCC